jgi:hypothetical protein
MVVAVALPRGDISGMPIFLRIANTDILLLQCCSPLCR